MILITSKCPFCSGVQWPDDWDFSSPLDKIAEDAAHELQSNPITRPAGSQGHRQFAELKSAVARAITLAREMRESENAL